jgi:hypothetical protein
MLRARSGMSEQMGGPASSDGKKHQQQHLKQIPVVHRCSCNCGSLFFLYEDVNHFIKTPANSLFEKPPYISEEACHLLVHLGEPTSLAPSA